MDAPEQAADGLSTAEDHSGVVVPVGADGEHPTGDDHADGDDESPDVEDSVEPESSGGPSDNHGAEVSAVATSDATEGVEHGEAVSEVARDGHGEDAGEAGDSHRAEESEPGADNAGEHGQP